ncbi:unnamed protein product, partial [Prorocentrum cordatum]
MRSILYSGLIMKSPAILGFPHLPPCVPLVPLVPRLVAGLVEPAPGLEERGLVHRLDVLGRTARLVGPTAQRCGGSPSESGQQDVGPSTGGAAGGRHHDPACRATGCLRPAA